MFYITFIYKIQIENMEFPYNDDEKVYYIDNYQGKFIIFPNILSATNSEPLTWQSLPLTFK